MILERKQRSLQEIQIDSNLPFCWIYDGSFTTILAITEPANSISLKSSVVWVDKSMNHKKITHK